MSVILEFSIAATDFQLGEVLAGSPDMEIELERIVPTGDMVMPYVWTTGEEQAAFAELVRSQPSVGEFVKLDRVGDATLYRVEWMDPPVDLIEGISRADAVVLEARGDDTWRFRLRFPGHEHLSAFHDYVVDHGIPLHVDRTYSLSEATAPDQPFDLTPEQREALLLALRNGYFETPSETTLAELAAELDISRQALSNRIRRGNEKVLTGVLLSTDAAAE